jgi:hypothetical protein
MSFLFAVAKCAALAAALLCLSSIGPGLLLADAEQPSAKATATTTAVSAMALRCRMYFGCAPAGF